MPAPFLINVERVFTMKMGAYLGFIFLLWGLFGAYSYSKLQQSASDKPHYYAKY